jgi:hypothetical protein
VPLPPGSGSGAYRAAFDRVVAPALEAYRPQLVLVSAGYDASYMDPLGQMMCGSEDYRWGQAQPPAPTAVPLSRAKPRSAAARVELAVCRILWAASCPCGCLAPALSPAHAGARHSPTRTRPPEPAPHPQGTS